MKPNWIFFFVMLFVFGTVSAIYSYKLHGIHNQNIAIYKQNNKMLIEENNALRKLVIFEKTLLPFFSDKTKDKLLATEGCLKLGG